jgi:hypothetical protein
MKFGSGILRADFIQNVHIRFALEKHQKCLDFKRSLGLALAHAMARFCEFFEIFGAFAPLSSLLRVRK